MILDMLVTIDFRPFNRGMDDQKKASDHFQRLRVLPDGRVKIEIFEAGIR